jgi:type IV secretory pathway VirB2 component (pilin)
VNKKKLRQRLAHWIPLIAILLPGVVLAQGSPFDTGANSMVNFALTIATPIAVLVVIGLGIAAAVGRIRWGLAIGAIVGTAVIFGAPQIIAWIRTMFAV